jgi:hypothetical protein
MGVGAAVVCADLLTLNLTWVVPTGVLLILGIFVRVSCSEYMF